MAKTGSIFLNLIKSLSPKKIEDIIAYLTDTDKIFSVSEADLQKIPSLADKDIKAIMQMRQSPTLDREIKLIEKERIKVIDLFDRDYPLLLKEISHPPLVLYIKGELHALNNFAFAIVGTRIPTHYGVSMAESFAYKLASLGIVIVSGLARGIDTAAHKGALKAGSTIAVLGSGLGNLYPKENRALSEQIALKGTVLSEFPLEEPPLKENFPRRNRIVSGISRGVLVIEAATKSGALITAHHALEQNREVFALPGNADSLFSKGAHSLIKEGAKLVDSIDDILEELNIKFEKKELPRPQLKSEEQAIFNLIGKDGVYLEEIILKGKFNQALVSKTLLDLQLKGLVREITPSCFVRCR